MGDVEEGTEPDTAEKHNDKQASPANAAANGKPVTPKEAAAVAAAAAAGKQVGSKEHVAVPTAAKAADGVTHKQQNPSSPAPGSTADTPGADRASAGKTPSGKAVAARAEAGEAAPDQPVAAAEKAASSKLTATPPAAKATTAQKTAPSAAGDAAAATSAQKSTDTAAWQGSGVAAASGSSGGAAQTPASGKRSAAADGDAADIPAAAAAVGLPDDPNCTPGTPEFETAAKKARETLEVYKARTKQHLQANRAKPDMIAYSELRSQHTPAESHGHIAGVRVGQEFLGRGELAILGLHTSMMRGIMSKKGKPAYAIAMSGGYKDDTDTGQTFWYTGQGGQKAGRQTEDQSYESPDNAALVASYKSNAPVRVFRGKVGTNGERLYVYEGLYRVAAHKMEQSQDGPLVCKFQMVGIPGHFVVSGTVEYKCLHKSQFQSQLLARGPAARPGKKRGRAGEVKLATRAEVEAKVLELKAAGKHGRLVTPDVSEGQEKLPIPVWNAVDDEDSILLHLGQQPEQPDPNSMEEEPPVFVYTRDYKFGEEEAKLLAIAAEKAFSSTFPGTCGIQYASKDGTKEGSYNKDGFMLSTQPSGVMECDEGCQHSKLCKWNRVVSEGIRYPLEVFKVNKEVGWGVRCSEDLPVGAFICCYIGLVITDDWADKLRHQDLYLFDLSHFHLLWDSDDVPEANLNPNLHQLQGELRSKHLVIDANRQGNVGRFINHSCDPNCVVQTIFAGNARSQLLYYVAIIAMKDIPAYSELTYDYGYSNKPAAAEAAGNAQTSPGDAASSKQDSKSVRIRCQCGSATCRRNLL